MAAALKHYDKNGFDQITGFDWGLKTSGAASTARKFGVQNIGTRDLGVPDFIMTITQVGSNDGFGQERTAEDTATLSPPWGSTGPPDASLSGAGAGGVWGSTGTRGYVVTATNATGETIASLEVTINVDVVTKKVTVTWTVIAAATGYKLYRTETPGTYGATTLRATLVGSGTNSFVDDGSATVAGTPPLENTTAGGSPNYGTAPSLGIVPVNFGPLPRGKTVYYWANLVIPASTPEAGNDRLADLVFSEG